MMDIAMQSCNLFIFFFIFSKSKTKLFLKKSYSLRTLSTAAFLQIFSKHLDLFYNLGTAPAMQG